MNDNGAPRRNAVASLQPLRFYRRDTRLQGALRVAFAALNDARDELTDDEYRALVEILCNRLGLEAARFVLGEALRATRRPAA